MFNSLPPEYKKRILCYYRNPTDRIQIARITDIPNWLYEQVVFPKQRLCFEATPDAHIEIHTRMLDRTAIFDSSLARGNECCGHFCKIPCRLLQVEEGVSYIPAAPLDSDRSRLEEDYQKSGSKASNRAVSL